MIWPTHAARRLRDRIDRPIDYLVCRYATAGNIDGRPVGYRIASNATALPTPLISRK